MSTEQTPVPFLFIGERLCVDFVNTETIQGGSRVDLLRGFEDLVSWCAAGHLVSTSEAKELLQRCSKRDAEQAFHQAIELRATLRSMLDRLASGQANVQQQALDAINDILRLRAGELEVVRTKGGYETRLRRQFDEPAQLLVPVAESAAELLSHDDLSLVKKCQNPQCILYFYDTTKNHARRWCSMAACGNRAKVAAHYVRARRQVPEK